MIIMGLSGSLQEGLMDVMSSRGENREMAV